VTRIRVVLADDHALVRQGFRRILEDEMDIEVIGEAGGGAEAVDLDQRLDPDVVVLDMNMPEINGLHAAIEILRRRPDRAILMLSMYDDVQYVRNAVNAGIKGYILKNALETDLIRAVRAVAAGKRFLSPELAAAIDGPPAIADAAEDERFAQLSAREIQVLRLIAMGRTNREIGKLLGVSANTVAVHRTNLMATLGVHKAAELVLIAVRKGLVNLQ
jgi:two-component system, NarL family, response regulator NreC